MKSRCRVALMVIVFSAIILALPVESRAGAPPDFVVAPNGNDANPGTADCFGRTDAARNHRQGVDGGRCND